MGNMGKQLQRVLQPNRSLADSRRLTDIPLTATFPTVCPLAGFPPVEITFSLGAR